MRPLNHFLKVEARTRDDGRFGLRTSLLYAQRICANVQLLCEAESVPRICDHWSTAINETVRRSRQPAAQVYDSGIRCMW